VRVWDYGVGVDIKYVADPSMHAIPATCLTPDGTAFILPHLAPFGLTSSFRRILAGTVNGQ